MVADGPLDEIRARSGRVRYVVSIQESSANYRGRGTPPKASEVQAALAAIKGVGAVTETPTDERAHAFVLSGETDADLRPELFHLVADKGWVLLELHRDTVTPRTSSVSSIGDSAGTACPARLPTRLPTRTRTKTRTRRRGRRRLGRRLERA